MIGKKLSKGFLIDSSGTLLREFVFSAKSDIDFPTVSANISTMGGFAKDGRKIHIIPQRVNPSPRRWEKEGVLYCTLRNWMLMALYSFGVPPEKLVKLYR